MRNRYLTALLALLALSTLSADAQGASPDTAQRTQGAPAAMPKDSFPDCKAPLSTVAVPSAPHGLFVLIFPEGTLNRRSIPILLHNPVICGADFYIVWSQSDHGPGANPRYDFGYIEEEMAPWVAAGKVVNLIVWATSDAHDLPATPDYVMSKVPTVSCPKFDRIPVFWDKNFMEPYKQFMSAVAEKYGSDPRIGYIRFGLASGGETFPACEWSLMDEKGLTQAVWKDYLFNMLDYEHSLHVTRQLMVGLNSFGNPPDDALPRAVAAKAAQLGIGIGSQGLSKSHVDDYRAGRPCDVDWCRLFDQYAGKIPLELQPAEPLQPDHSGTGSVTDIIPFALQRKTQIFEFNIRDFLIAYQPGGFPGAESHAAEWAQAYEAAAKVLGGH